MHKKKWILISTAAVLCVAVILGGVFFMLRSQRSPVDVYPVADLASWDTSYLNEYYTDSEVRTDNLQTVYLTETQQVTKILVSVGQEVRAGDALLNFDTSLTDLQLQRKKLELQQLQRDLETAKWEYNQLVGYAYYKLSASGQGSLPLVPLNAEDGGFSLRLLDDPESSVPSQSAADPSDPTIPADPPTSVLPGQEPVNGVVESYYCVGGNGTETRPYLYVFVNDIPFDAAFISGVLQNQADAYVVFAQTEGNRTDTLVLGVWGIHFQNAAGAYTFSLFDATGRLGKTLLDPTATNESKTPVEPEDPKDPEEPEEPEGPTEAEPPSYTGPSYAEIQQQREETAERIEELDLQIRMTKVEYETMQKELGDGVVYAEFDGVVTSVADPSEAFFSNEPVLKISGGGGYYLEGAISELKLNEISVGQSVSVSAYQSGTVCEGAIDSISDYPAQNASGYSAGDSNSNVTYYAFTVFVDESANLQAGEYVSMTLTTGGSSDNLFLEYPFILLENGKSYVYVQDEDGTLEKRQVSTGRDMWGSYLEITSGNLSQDDLIAFPYGRYVEPGAPTVEGDLNDLYQ